MSESQNRHVAVIGGGLVGIFTSYYLSQRGISVTLLEKQPTLASVTSAKNAGRFCPTRLATYPLANPEILRMVVGVPIVMVKRALGINSTDGEIDVPSKVSFTVPLVLWGIEYLSNCSPWRYKANNAVFQTLSVMSSNETEHLINEVSKHCKHLPLAVSRSNLWLYSNLEQLQHAETIINVAKQSGFPNSRVLSKRDILAEYPFLASHPAVSTATLADPKAIVANDDFSINSQTLALGVAFLCENGLAAEGAPSVTVRTNAKVVGLEFSDKSDQDKTNVRSVILSSGEELAVDGVVVCVGNDTNNFLRTHFRNVKPLPIQPARGYSLDLIGVEHGPSTTLIDFTSGTMSYQATPLHNGVVRISGFADFCGFNEELYEHDDDFHGDILVGFTRKVLPQLTWQSQSKIWRGYRPTTPDFLPIIGEVPGYRGAYINCGHGGLGLNLAASTGKLVAQLVDGDINTTVTSTNLHESLSIKRFSWATRLRGVIGL